MSLRFSNTGVFGAQLDDNVAGVLRLLHLCFRHMRNYKSTTGTYAGNHQKLHYVASRRAWVPLVYGLLDAKPLIPPDSAWASAIRGKRRGIRLVSDAPEAASPRFRRQTW